jgi:hypothetical protein
MTNVKWDELTPEERLLAEQMILNYRELNQTCDAAADGTVLEVCEKMALQQGWELTRRTIEVALQQQAHEVEKKERRVGRAAAESTAVLAAASPASSPPPRMDAERPAGGPHLS